MDVTKAAGGSVLPKQILTFPKSLGLLLLCSHQCTESETIIPGPLLRGLLCLIAMGMGSSEVNWIEWLSSRSSI